jgi:DNA uptake protein ComE-like DNA-binding protein
MYATQTESIAVATPPLVVRGACGYRIDNGRIIIDIAEIANNRDSELTLMLREWGPSGYVTRDYVSFSLPFVVSGEPVVAGSPTDNVINVDFTGSQKPSTLSAANKAEAAAIEPARPAATEIESPPKESPPPRATEPEVAATAPRGAPIRGAVSLNHADYGAIAAVKGISKKLAENIVAARPFESLQDVPHVKGMGKKLLQKVRQFITL